MSEHHFQFSGMLLFSVGVTLLAAPPCLADGAMGLALAIFPFEMWLIYVVVTVLFEGWLLGGWLGVRFQRALGISVGANLLTAILGIPFTGIAGYIFTGLGGSALNPDPFLETVLLFTLFGIGSGFIEGWFWRRAARQAGWTRLHPVLASMAVHLAGVPLGLAILLAPPRPYHGLEMQVQGNRFFWLRKEVSRALNDYLVEHKRLPPGRTYGEILEALRPDLLRFGHDPCLWAAAYWPEYHRFDLGENRRGPMMEWNPVAKTVRLSDPLLDRPAAHPLWLTQIRTADWCEGLVLMGDGTVQWTRDAAELGYAPALGTAPGTSRPATLVSSGYPNHTIRRSVDARPMTSD